MGAIFSLSGAHAPMNRERRSIGAQDAALGVEEEPAGGDERRSWRRAPGGRRRRPAAGWIASRMWPEPCVPPSESAPPCGFTGIRPSIRMRFVVGVPVVLDEVAGLAGPAPARVLDPAEGDDGEAVVREVHVDVVDPDVALAPSATRRRRAGRGRRRLGVWSSSFWCDHAERGRVDEHGRAAARSRARSVGGDDERIGAVDRHVHVEQAQRPADHPGREVVVHRDRVADVRRRDCARRWSDR